MELKPTRFDATGKKRKTTAFFVLRAFCLLNLFISFTASSQTADIKISLTVTNAPLEQVFKEIKKQSGYEFVYTREQLKKSVSVSLAFEGATLSRVLEACFKEQPFSYVMEGKHIVLRERSEQVAQAPATKEVTGIVRDESGNPLGGVTVTVKSTGNATATDNEGFFSLLNVRESDILLVSAIGYRTEMVAVKGRSRVDIRLSVAVSQMDEALVIAYGTTTRRFSTGSVSKISSKEIESQPVDNLVSAIQGRAPGVFITTLNGLPGGNMKVEIRGRGSIAAGTDPLYIVDGVPFSSTPLNEGFVDFTAVNGEISPLSTINPLDIESIEVLRDADATAIYGSRGANGVVLITTKKGKTGKTKFDLTISQGFSELAQFPKFLNTDQYLELRREAFKNDGIAPTLSRAPELFLWDPSQYINWGKYMWGKTASRTNIQSSISGGTGGTSFLLSGYYRKEGTILAGSENYASGGGHLSLQHSSANKKFQLQASASYSADNSRLILSSTLATLSLPPNFPLYDSTGNLNWIGSSTNPVAMINQRSKNTSTSFITNASAQYLVAPGLTLKTSFGFTSTSLDQMGTIPKFTISPSAPQSSNSSTFGTNSHESVLVEPQANYQKVFKGSKLDILFGGSIQRSLRKGSLVKATDFSNEELMESMGAAGSFEYTRSLYSEYKYASVFGRVNFRLRNKYLFTGTVRRDGSSRFGPGNQYGNFGSLGAGWIFTEEPFMKKNLPFFSYGKIRASYGVTGNDQIPDYQYLSAYKTGTTYQNVPGLSPSIIANALYSWESNRKLEAALELGAIKDRLLFTVTYFRNRSSNQLVGFPLPYLTGFSSFQANLPALIENTGVELELGAELIKRKAILLSITFNLSRPKNKLVSYPGLEASSYANSFVVGEDINVVKGYRFLGVDPQTGLASYEDVNKDGKISQPQDFIVIGKTTPDYYGGFGQKLDWKSFSLDLFFQFVKQRSRGAEMFPGHSRNQFATVLNRWQKPGDITDVPRASAVAGTPGFTSNANLALSDAFFYDASYIRFKNIALSYALPSRLTSKVHMEKWRVYLNGQNLFTLKKKANLNDPEALQGGIPPLRTLVAGIQITF